MGRRDGRFTLTPSIPNMPTVRGEAKDNVLLVSDDLVRKKHAFTNEKPNVCFIQTLSLPCEPTFLNFEILLRES